MDTESLMNDIYKYHKAEIDQSMRDTHEISRDLRNSSGMSKQGSMKFVGRIPSVIYARMTHAYGPDCWNDDKFITAFFKAYNRFQIGVRP